MHTSWLIPTTDYTTTILPINNSSQFLSTSFACLGRKANGSSLGVQQRIESLLLLLPSYIGAMVRIRLLSLWIILMGLCICRLAWMGMRCPMYKVEPLAWNCILTTVELHQYWNLHPEQTKNWNEHGYLNKASHHLRVFDLLGTVVQVGVVYLPSSTIMFLPPHKRLASNNPEFPSTYQAIHSYYSQVSLRIGKRSTPPSQWALFVSGSGYLHGKSEPYQSPAILLSPGHSRQ